MPVSSRAKSSTPIVESSLREIGQLGSTLQIPNPPAIEASSLQATQSFLVPLRALLRMQQCHAVEPLHPVSTYQYSGVSPVAMTESTGWSEHPCEPPMEWLLQVDGYCLISLVRVDAH